MPGTISTGGLPGGGLRGGSLKYGGAVVPWQLDTRSSMTTPCWQLLPVGSLRNIWPLVSGVMVMVCGPGVLAGTSVVPVVESHLAAGSGEGGGEQG